MQEVSGKIDTVKAPENTAADGHPLRESRARERALRDILSIINRSRADENPVFEAVLQKATELCETTFASLWLVSEDRSRVIRAWNTSSFDKVTARPREETGNSHYRLLSDTDSALVKPIHARKTYYTGDVRHVSRYFEGRSPNQKAVETSGIRVAMSVPLLSGDEAIGVILLCRLEVKPFTDDQIKLVETFADQAVIAIENVRQFREVQVRLEREAATREILQVISASRADDAPVFDLILEKAADLCQAQFAGLGLLNAEGTHLVYRASHGSLAHSDCETLQWSLDGPSSFAQAIREQRPVCIDDLADTEAYRQGDPQRVVHADRDGIRSFLAVPLMLDGRAIGAFGLARMERKPFARSDLELLSGFAEQAVIAIENVHQFKALETLNAELGERVEKQVAQIERMGRLKRFLPAAVADTVMATGADEMLRSHRSMLGVLFCDIRGFTAFCETAEPEETIEVLQTYHEEMGKLIGNYGAGVDHRMGDGIMVLFNDPLACDDPAGSAVRLGIAMRERMDTLCKRWKRLGHKLGFGVGISLGYATVGMVGYEERFEYTASGTAINLASRLCDEARGGEILLSARAQIAIEHDFETQSVGEVSLKGMREPLEVFRLLGRRAD